MRMGNKKGWALLFVAALLIGILPRGDVSVSNAEETLDLAGNCGLRNPIVKAVSPPDNTSHGLSNPRNENGTVTWDCVYFGNYWQSDTNGDGVADKDDEKEPIKWRVLSVDGDDVFLLADMNLDTQEYDDMDGKDVTWEVCTMRSWLNGYGADENICGIDYSGNSFLNDAFTASEQEAIQNTTVVNEDYPEYGVEGGNDTLDKVYLLSLGEVMNPSYGFTSTRGMTMTREAEDTAYVAAGDYVSNVKNVGPWWLRSHGHINNFESGVYYFGYVNQSGNYNISTSPAVRPALHLNLSSGIEWTKAGTVSSDGGDVITTWDCIWFGNYPQSDAAGVVKDPIKWRVLSVNGDDAFLLSDTNLDVHRYNDTVDDAVPVTWETSTIRAWLNNDFLNKAFRGSEQEAIKNTTVVNEDNPVYNTEGGNDTVDKVYLLSLSEARNPSYGFISTEDSTATRQVVNTAYMGTRGGTDYTWRTYGRAEWWLRSSGYRSNHVCVVGEYGSATDIGLNPNSDYVAVRPVFHLNLSSTSEWSYAGTVSSTGEKNEIPASNSPIAPTPDTTLVPSVTERPSAVEPVVTGTPSAGQNPVVVSSPTHTRDIFEEAQEKDVKITLGKVNGLKLKAKKKAIQARWKKVSGAVGYEVQVSTSKKFAKKSVKTTKKQKLTISRLKPKRKYFVRVRAYSVANGKKKFGRWSKVVNIKTKK